MSFTPFPSGKPLVNITMLGAPCHGKTALFGALESMAAPESLPMGKTGYAAFESNDRWFHCYDIAGRDLTSGIFDAELQFDGAILVVSADEGPTAATRTQLALAKDKGVQPLVVFLNQFDEGLGKTTMRKRITETKKLLSESGFIADKVTFVTGSAVKPASVVICESVINGLFAATNKTMAVPGLKEPTSAAASAVPEGGKDEPSSDLAADGSSGPSPRVVNAQIEESPAKTPAKAADPSQPLVPEREYDLAVQIGAHQATSQVENPPDIAESLPPLAPDETHWLLEVVVFEKDFELLSGPVQLLKLPKVGETETVRFRIKTPAQAGCANLRFSIYHRNHLVQSFALVAPIGNASLPARLRIVCDFAQSADLTNLDALKPRAVSIGLNRDFGSGTHRLFVKGTSVQRTITLDETWMKTKTEAFRTLLATHAVTPAGYSRLAKMAKPERALEFDAVIRELAVLGNEVFRGLFTKASSLVWDMLKVPELPVQIARMSSEHAYPWPILYDFELPEQPTGPLKAPVCRGRKGNCPCDCDGKSSRCYCLRGFWGFRHQIEELVSLDDNDHSGDREGGAATEVKPRNAPHTIAGPQQPVSLGLLTDREADLADLDAALKRDFGDQFVDLNGNGATAPELLKTLWTGNTRPVVVVAFGHLEPVVGGTEIKATKFSLRNGQWLTSDDLWSKAAHGGPWGCPPSLVFLMMCKSGAVTIGAVNDFAQPFILAGSSGVIGAETYIFPDQAAELVRSIVADLRAGKRMGEAMQRYWQARAEAGDPFGFSFFYLGPADLTLS